MTPYTEYGDLLADWFAMSASERTQHAGDLERLRAQDTSLPVRPENTVYGWIRWFPVNRQTSKREDKAA